MTRCLAVTMLLISIVVAPGCKDKQSTPDVVVNKTTATSKDSTNAPSGTKYILCFGNSLTAGYGLDASEAWPALLQNRLDSLGYNYQVINAGLSGETTSGGLNRIEWVLQNKVDIFILELGANDMLRGLDVRASRNNLEGIIEKVNEKYPEAHVVIAGMLAPPNMGDRYENAFNNMYPELAKTYDATLIPFFLKGVAGHDTLNLSDGIHPNPAGQKILLENVWSALKDHL